MSEWRDIATAPKHSKPIWGCDVLHGFDAKILHNGREWECVSFDNFPMGVGFYPTHWQPLPDLPSLLLKATEKGEKGNA